jgi:predicted DNA-binding protein (MmcQ/YjbR family)
VIVTRDDLCGLCESHAGAVPEYPFGPDVRAYKAGGKVFALVPEDGSSISLKCDPALAEILRGRYASITPGYHLNKRHWNTIAMDGAVPAAEIAEMVRHSHELIVRSLTKAQRAALERA